MCVSAGPATSPDAAAPAQPAPRDSQDGARPPATEGRRFPSAPLLCLQLFYI